MKNVSSVAYTQYVNEPGKATPALSRGYSMIASFSTFFKYSSRCKLTKRKASF